MKILFADGTAGWSPSRLNNRPCGGIATSLTIIPQYLSRKGHEVWVKSAHNKEEEVNGVKYLQYARPSPKADVVVLNRNMVTANAVDGAHTRGATVIWWLHDIVDPRYLEDGSYRKVDGVVSLSEYCTKTYSKFYELDERKFKKIPNGVDTAVWKPGSYSQRDANLFVMASAPIKGYRPMEFTFLNIKRNIPEAKLDIYSSQRLHDIDDNPFVKDWYKKMKAVGATIREPIPQPELAKVFQKAWILLMPNSYPEICSNIILQAQACGLPLVTTPIGSAPEFVTDNVNGMMTHSTPNDLHFWNFEFAKITVQLALNTDRHKTISEKASQNVLSWDAIGEMWDNYVREIAAKN